VSVVPAAHHSYRSLFSVRKDPNAVHSISANIVIDKHELHATWPIYSQPDSRQVRNGALELIVKCVQSVPRL